MSSKDLAIEFIRTLPENLTIEEIAYRLYFEQKLRNAQQQIKDGNCYTHEQAKEIMKKWLD